jgi:hypothetical protein
MFSIKCRKTNTLQHRIVECGDKALDQNKNRHDPRNGPSKHTCGMDRVPRRPNLPSAKADGSNVAHSPSGRIQTTTTETPIND